MALSTRQLIRYLSGAAIALVLAGLVVITVERARTLTGSSSRLGAIKLLAGAEGVPANEYIGFEYVERVAGQLIFALDANRTLGFESGWHEIEGVRLQLYGEDGSRGPLLSCSSAAFNIETKDARLAGGIQVAFPDGAVLSTESGLFNASLRRLETDTPVTFTDGVTIAEARSAVYLMEQDRLLLEQGTMIDAARGIALAAPTVVYRRSEHLVLLAEGARITLPQIEITGGRGSIEFDPDDSQPRRVALWDGVEAVGRSGATVLRRAATDSFVAERDAADDWQIEALSRAQWTEVELGPGPGHYLRRLQTFQLRASIGAEGPRNLRADRGVCLLEIPVTGPPRVAEADAGTIWFEHGEGTDIELVQDVRIEAESGEARGFRARISTARNLVMLHGDPSSPKRAVVLTDRGRVLCDQINLFDSEQRLEARGNVQGEIEGLQLMTSGGGGADAPLMFAAESLDISQKGAEYHLQGTARTWQGARLLLADDILYQASAGTVTARGHVRTTLPADEIEPDAAAGSDVVVIARSLDYDSVARTAVYRGTVRYADERHTLAASELSLASDEAGVLTEVRASGAVEIVDLATGRRMTGQEAVRDLASETVTLRGSPVQLTDDKGNVVSGSSLTWNRANGSVAVAGDTETIFFPEDSP